MRACRAGFVAHEQGAPSLMRLPLWFRSLAAFLALPLVYGVLLPLALAARDPGRREDFWPAGVLLILPGMGVLLVCVRDFAVVGKGTLAPWDPPRRLVTTGLYARSRNPMYAGLLLLVAGIALAAGSTWVAAYGLILGAAFHLRVILYEEPRLRRGFGGEFDRYC